MLQFLPQQEPGRVRRSGHDGDQQSRMGKHRTNAAQLGPGRAGSLHSARIHRHSLVSWRYRPGSMSGSREQRALFWSLQALLVLRAHAESFERGRSLDYRGPDPIQ